MTPGRFGAVHAWQKIGEALSTSSDVNDRRSAAEIARFVTASQSTDNQRHDFDLRRRWPKVGQIHQRLGVTQTAVAGSFVQG